MRRIVWCVSTVWILGAIVLLPSRAAAQENASLAAFGGMSLNTVASESITPSVGGTLTFNVAPAVQIVGEAGRLGNVLPMMSDAAFSAADLGVRVSALYGEGGLRFLMAPGSAVTPYVEGTAGVARLGVSTDRFGPIADAAATLALQFVDRTTPTAGGGAGILLRGGPIMFDIGYRYKHLFADDLLRVGLGFGQQLHTHQARIGFGFRF